MVDDGAEMAFSRFPTMTVVIVVGVQMGKTTWMGLFFGWVG